MRRRQFLAGAAGTGGLALAGCSGGGGGSEGEVESELRVVHHTEGSILAGGITIEDTRATYLTAITEQSGVDRFDMAKIEELQEQDVTGLIEGTDFSNSFLVVFQEEGVPERPIYRLSDTSLSDGTLTYRLNDSGSGTTGYTVETVLIRTTLPDGGIPDEVTVFTEDAREFSVDPRTAFTTTAGNASGTTSG